MRWSRFCWLLLTGCRSPWFEELPLVPFINRTKFLNNNANDIKIKSFTIKVRIVLTIIQLESQSTQSRLSFLSNLGEEVFESRIIATTQLVDILEQSSRGKFRDFKILVTQKALLGHPSPILVKSPLLEVLVKGFLQSKWNHLEVRYHSKNVVQGSSDLLSFWSIEGYIEYFLLELAMKFQHFVKGRDAIQGLPEPIPAALDGNHQVAEKISQEMVHWISENIAGMKKMLNFRSSSLPHPDGLVLRVNHPDPFQTLFNLFGSPQKEKDLLVVHHYLRRKQSLHRFYFFKRILQVETVPAFTSSSVVYFFGQQSI